jgi:transcriptional coactivator p15 (PC4)
MTDNPDILLGEIDKNARELIRVLWREYRRKPFLDIRVLYRPGDGEEPKPSGKGVTVSPDNLPAFFEALAEVERLARERGLLPSSSEDGAA